MAAAAAATAKAASSKDDKKKAAPPAAKRPLPEVKERPELTPLLLPSLYRLTEGLPRRELKMMVSEAKICEEALEKEIRELQEALELEEKTEQQQNGNPKEQAKTAASQKPPATTAAESPSVAIMLESEATPPDRFFTVSALLGRLRDDLATPLPPNSTLPALRAKATAAQTTKKKKKEAAAAAAAAGNQKAPPSQAAASPKGDAPPQPGVHPTITTVGGLPTTPSLEKQKRVLSLYQSPEYNREHTQPTALLALWKKISTHRSSVVFRRPVNPKEAPGYTDRIFFPMDLALIRKMIVSRQVRTYSQLHQRMGLIAHNCVKYNGRESDYGLVTREFESNVDEMVVAAVATGAAEAARLQKTATPPNVATNGKPTGTPAAVAGTKRPAPTPAAVAIAKQAKTVATGAALSATSIKAASVASTQSPPAAVAAASAATGRKAAVSITKPGKPPATSTASAGPVSNKSNATKKQAEG